MVRYYGYYSNVSRAKRKIQDKDEVIPSILEPDGASREFRKNWARLIQKIEACHGLEKGVKSPIDLCLYQIKVKRRPDPLHLSTSFAGWGIRRFEWLIRTAGCVGLNIQGVRDLTRESCKQRNRLTIKEWYRMKRQGSRYIVIY